MPATAIGSVSSWPLSLLVIRVRSVMSNPSESTRARSATQMPRSLEPARQGLNCANCRIESEQLWTVVPIAYKVEHEREIADFGCCSEHSRAGGRPGSRAGAQLRHGGFLGRAEPTAFQRRGQGREYAVRVRNPRHGSQYGV